MTTQYIWFGTRAVRFEGGGNLGPQIELLDEAADFATRALPAGTFDATGSEWLQLLAFSGDAGQMAALGVDLSDGVDAATTGAVNTTGDLRVGSGVTAQNIADIAGNGRVMDVTNTLDGSDDVVALSGLGKASSAFLSGATIDSTETGNRVVFSNDIGFGFIGGSGFDPGGNAQRLNDGEAISFAIRQGRVLSEASFTVKVLGNAATRVLLDSDGATLRDTNGAAAGGLVQDASAGELDLGLLAHGAKVRVDYVNAKIFVNAAEIAGDASAFFAAFATGGSKTLTLGSVLGNNTGWSADDLVLATDATLVVNSPPVAAPTAVLALDEDGSAGGTVGATDSDLDTLAYAIAPGDGAANGTATVNGTTGDYLYVPDADFFGTDSFTITVDDGNGGTATQVVSVTVAAVNDAPVVFGYGGGEGDEDTLILGNIDAGDIDGGALAYTVETGDGPAHGGLVMNVGDGSFAYTPDANYNGGDSFIVTVSDGLGGITTQVVSLFVLAANDAASFDGAATGAVAEDGTLVAGGTLTVADVDAGEAIFAGTGALAGTYGDFTFVLATGAWTYTLRNGDANVQALGGGVVVQDTLAVTSADGSGTSIVVDVTGAPDPIPAINLDAVAAGTGGFKVVGENSGDFAGQAVAAIDDLNGDGRAELLIGAYWNDAGGSDAGAAYVVWGKADGALVDLDAVAAGSGGFKVVGETGSNQAGISVSSIADLNGDGKAELLVGANQNLTLGAAYVVWGKADGAAVNLDDVAAGTGGFKVFGENIGDDAGASVSSIGDLNGDGKAELLIGARFNDAGGGESGAAYVVWGKADGTAINLDDVAAGTGGFKVFGEGVTHYAGWSVSSIGDLNGDGRDELVIGAIGVGSLAGATYVVWGKSDGAAINLDDVAAGTGGFKVLGESGADLAGISVASIGDLNGDGKAELLIGSINNDAGGGDAGAAYVVWGKSDGATINLDDVAAGTGGFKVVGESGIDLAGISVASVGDLNGDGSDELLIGSNQNDNAGGSNAGAAYVVWGKAGGAAINLDDVAAGVGGFKLFGEAANGLVGQSVSAVGDMNGDGLAELLIGSTSNATYVVFSQADWIGAA